MLSDCAAEIYLMLTPRAYHLIDEAMYNISRRPHDLFVDYRRQFTDENESCIQSLALDEPLTSGKGCLVNSFLSALAAAEALSSTVLTSTQTFPFPFSEVLPKTISGYHPVDTTSERPNPGDIIEKHFGKKIVQFLTL